MMALVATWTFFAFAPLWAVLGAFIGMGVGFFIAVYNQLIFKVGISEESIVLKMVLGKREIKKLEIVDFDINPPLAESDSDVPWYMQNHRLTLNLTRKRTLILANIERHILVRIEEVLLE